MLEKNRYFEIRSIDTEDMGNEIYRHYNVVLKENLGEFERGTNFCFIDINFSNNTIEFYQYNEAIDKYEFVLQINFDIIITGIKSP